MASPRAGSPEGASLVTRLLERTTERLNLLLARADDCHPQEDVDLCEKPRASTQTVTWIVVGVILGVFLIGSLCVLLFFHMKKRKSDKREDLEDQFQMSDYGLDDATSSRQKKQPQGPQRLSFDDLPQPGQPLGRHNPFDDSGSTRSGHRSNTKLPRQPPPILPEPQKS